MLVIQLYFIKFAKISFNSLTLISFAITSEEQLPAKRYFHHLWADFNLINWILLFLKIRITVFFRHSLLIVFILNSINFQNIIQFFYQSPFQLLVVISLILRAILSVYLISQISTKIPVQQSCKFSWKLFNFKFLKTSVVAILLVPLLANSSNLNCSWIISIPI